jgi:trans-aconitate methyltransferase
MNQLDDLVNAWKENPEVFRKQLELNKFELSTRHPPHWYDFLQLLAESKAESVLDIGCGCGAVRELFRRYVPHVKYFGIDYSQDAIALAIETWAAPDEFGVKDYKDITKEDVADYDLFHLGAVLDILPNADEALDNILTLCPLNVIIGRMKITQLSSHFTTYVAYNAITTCEYYHNEGRFLKLCESHKYSVDRLNDSFLLRKQR